MDLFQQVFNAPVVELVATVTVLIQLANLTHEEIGNLKAKHSTLDWTFLVKQIFKSKSVTHEMLMSFMMNSASISLQLLHNSNLNLLKVMMLDVCSPSPTVHSRS